MSISPLFRGITLFAMIAVLFVWTGTQAAIITTVSGERIVCEIIEERPEYYIIDHDGYRRYLLKELIRSVELDPPVVRDPNPMRHHSLGVIGGYYRNVQSQSQELAGVRVSYAFPFSEHVAIEANAHFGAGTVNESAGSKLDPGDMLWSGGSLGALWNTRIGPTFWFVESSLGYFVIDHTIDPAAKSKRLIVNRALEIIPAGQTGDFEQNPDNGFGLVFGGGFMYPIFRHLAVETRATIIMIDSRMRDVVTYDPIAGDALYSTGKHVNTYELFTEMAQFQVALRWTF
ncbi:MAG TPA: hypothetical protein ENN56_01520 [Firmicutes bacterium]|nr:hypothetical protein [Bacillota bacterium]